MPSSAAAGGLGRIGGAGHAPARGLEVSNVLHLKCINYC